MINQQGDILFFDDGIGGEINIENGIIEMTGGFETAFFLAVFGGDLPFWGNDVILDDETPLVSTFPDVIKKNVVSDNVRKDGEKAIEKDLAFLVDQKIADSVKVFGSILTVHSIKWDIQITKPSGDSKFQINWDSQLKNIILGAS